MEDLRRIGKPNRLWKNRPRHAFQFFQKIINAICRIIGFNGNVNQRTDALGAVPACNGSRFGGLIMVQNQNGADLC
jgi:hypothetical protein